MTMIDLCLVNEMHALNATLVPHMKHQAEVKSYCLR